MIGYANVEKISYMTADEMKALGVTWNLSQEEYLVFFLANIVACNRKFSGSNLRSSKFYTNYFCFKEFINSKGEDMLKMDNFYLIRFWKEVRNIDPNCKVTKGTIRFTNNKKHYICTQDKKDHQRFLINDKVFLLNESLKEVLNPL